MWELRYSAPFHATSPQSMKRYRLASYFVRSRFFAKLIAALATLTLVLAMRGPVVSASAQSSRVLLTEQTATVVATLSDQSAFSLGLALGGSEPTSATVSTQIYSRLSTRSGLLAALGGQGLTNQIGQSEPLPFSCLPAAPKGGQLLTIAVVTSSATTPTLAGGCSGSARPPSYNLHCTIGSGGCNGVYPVAVTVNQGTTELAHFITLMTYVERPAVAPLKVALVLRLGSTNATRTPAELSAAEKAIRLYPSVQSDLSVSPVFLQQLEGTSSGKSVVTQFAQSISGAPTTHEIPKSGYVPIDPGVLLTSSLQSDVGLQLKRSQTIHSDAGLPADSATSGWVGTSSVTSSTLSSLLDAGFSRIIIPDSSLAQPTATALNWGQPFTVTSGNATLTALAADGTLSAQMLPANDPVLAAERFLGDLAFLHFERPSLTTPQGVVAQTPIGFTATTGFLDTVFQGLSANPVVTTSTLTALFSELTIGANGAPTSRQLASNNPSPPWPAAQVAALNLETTRQRAFASAVTNGQSTMTALADQALATENAALTNATRANAINATSSSLDRELARINISSGDITMTALNGTIPITLTSTAPYTVHGVLTVASPQLRFPHGNQSDQVIDRSTKSVRITAQAVTSGDFSMRATLTTPQGDLAIANQSITVRATQSSIVGVILTAGALLVLFGWWIKTWRSKATKKKRRTL